jgi:uncharacterized protein HemX
MEGETHTENTENEGERISDERYEVGMTIEGGDFSSEENQDLEEDSDGLYDPSSERQTQGKQFSVWEAPEIYVEGVNENVFSKQSTRRWMIFAIIFLLIGAGVVSSLFAKRQAHNKELTKEIARNQTHNEELTKEIAKSQTHSEELTKEIERLEIQLNEAKSKLEESEKQLKEIQSVN